MGAVFYNCQVLTSVGSLDTWNTSNVTNMAYMFYYCYVLTSVGSLDTWATGNVTTMSYMFQDCQALTGLDIKDWNVSNVTTAENMLVSVDLTTAVYDQTLINYEALATQSNVKFHFGNSKYTAGGVAETARTNLINNDSWTIIDGGVV